VVEDAAIVSEEDVRFRGRDARLEEGPPCCLCALAGNLIFDWDMADKGRIKSLRSFFVRSDLESKRMELMSTAIQRPCRRRRHRTIELRS
jgi:hypothetical protein